MRSRAVVAAIAGAVVVALVAVSCSSDDDSSAPTTTSDGEGSAGMVPLPSSFPAPTGPPCATEAGGSLLVTVECVDPELGTAPYIDVDEQRTTTDPDTDVTVEYRYVHGGFTDTDVRFSFYFPAADAYQGRFFESTYPTITTEDADDETVVFAIANGAYAVSSNNAGGVAASPTLGGYRANAAAAKFSRVVAAELYGADAPVRGYIYGGSGGAYQTLASAENTDGVWQGAVPIVPGVPNSIPSFMSVQVLALRLLADEWPNIVDAMEPGGSGDPYATLDADERAVLEEAT
ncbi:MAG TPA: hypothetical protein VIY72_08615, partial [Acidimicrobiales bacterium]